MKIWQKILIIFSILLVVSVPIAVITIVGVNQSKATQSIKYATINTVVTKYGNDLDTMDSVASSSSTATSTPTNPYGIPAEHYTTKVETYMIHNATIVPIGMVEILNKFLEKYKNNEQIDKNKIYNISLPVTDSATYQQQYKIFGYIQENVINVFIKSEQDYVSTSMGHRTGSDYVVITFKMNSDLTDYTEATLYANSTYYSNGSRFYHAAGYRKVFKKENLIYHSTYAACANDEGVDVENAWGIEDFSVANYVKGRENKIALVQNFTEKNELSTMIDQKTNAVSQLKYAYNLKATIEKLFSERTEVE